MVARAPADGYTLLLGSSSEIAQYPNVASNVPYDPQRDFTPIALLATARMRSALATEVPPYFWTIMPMTAEDSSE